MKILILTKKVPYPLKDGESIAVSYLAKGLVSKGASVTLLSINTPKHHSDVSWIKKDCAFYDDVFSVDVNTDVTVLGALSNLFSQDSYHISRFVDTRFEQMLKKILKENTFDIVQVETVFMAPYIQVIRKFSDATVVMRAHNVEYTIWQRITQNTANIIKRKYLAYLTKKLKDFEIKSLDSYDFLIPVSPIDLKAHKEMGYEGKAETIPIGMELKKYKPGNIGQLSMCFIGSLDWLPNVEGLTWFLDKVMPLIPEIDLHIAGRNMPRSFLEGSTPNVKVHGEVEDALSYMQDYEIHVVPLFSGSGTRVKILEAMALGKIVLTTSIGLEGIPAVDGKDLFICDDKNSFVSMARKLLMDDTLRVKISKSARAFVEEHYDNDKIAERLLKKYRSLRSG